MLRGRSFVSFVRLDAFGTYIYRNDDYFERIGGQHWLNYATYMLNKMTCM